MLKGSFINHLMADSAPAVPQVGLGATELCWSDRHAYTVVEVAANGRRCVVQRDRVSRLDQHGMSEAQHWAFEPDTDGGRRTLSLRKGGVWKEVGTNVPFLIGVRQEYHDYSH